VGGYWRRHADGGFDFDDYKSVAASNTRDRLSELPLICANGAFSPGDVACMERTLRRAEAFDAPAVLCHGDYAPRHIICGEHINGIIDFGNFFGGSPYADLAYFSLNSDENCFNEFLNGYGAIDTDELHANIIMKLMGYLAHARQIGDDEEARVLEGQLMRAIRV